MLTSILRTLRRAQRDDAGFTLIEVVVAMVVFALTVSGVLGVVLSTLDVTRSNTHRVAAANLATKQIESTRSMRTLDIPDAATVRTETVAGTTFTINQTASYVVAGADSSVCQGSGNQLAYKLVTVTVEWPDMGAVEPVRSDTLKALGVGEDGLDPDRGSLAVAVTSASGAPLTGVPVTLIPGSQTLTTGADGCAVFVNLDDDVSYTAEANEPGYVGSVNVQLTRLDQDVRPGEVTRGELLYDRARSLAVDWEVPAGHVPPAGLPLRYRSTYVSDGAVFPACGTVTAGTACLSTVPGTVDSLFPAVYELSAGSCVDSRVGRADVDLRPGDGSVDVPLAGYRVLVVDGDANPLSSRSVTATHAADSDATGCPSGETWELSSTDVLGLSLTALPFGEWTFSTPGGQAAVTAVVAPGDGVRTVVLVVDDDEDEEDD